MYMRSAHIYTHKILKSLFLDHYILYLTNDQTHEDETVYVGSMYSVGEGFTVIMTNNELKYIRYGQNSSPDNPTAMWYYNHHYNIDSLRVVLK